MSHSSKRNQAGFTLVEMIVSLAVFSVVITVAVGALLTLIYTNSQLQSEQSVLTNLSFALDSMTREIRTGTYYYCVDSGDGAATAFNDVSNVDSVIGQTSVNNCPNGKDPGDQYQGVAFAEAGNSITTGANRRILYFFDSDTNKIYRKYGTNVESIVSSGIYVVDAEFFVDSPAPVNAAGTGNNNQPAVTIFIKAKETADSDKEYNIQTTVTQRTLDI